MFKFVQKMMNCVAFYSKKNVEFKQTFKARPEAVKKMKELEVKKINKISSSVYIYDEKSKVNLEKNSLDCIYFFKCGFCSHLLLIHKQHKKNAENEFVLKKKRGKPKKIHKTVLHLIIDFKLL